MIEIWRLFYSFTDEYRKKIVRSEKQQQLIIQNIYPNQIVFSVIYIFCSWIYLKSNIKVKYVKVKRRQQLSNMSTQVFRLADSSLLFPVWKCIRECPPNKIADEIRISKALAKSNSLTETETIELLDKLTDDGLVLRNIAGKTAVYMLPHCVAHENDGGETDDDQEELGDLLQLRDSYCYECHLPGEILMCSQCPRVFHTECVRPETAIDLPLLPFKEPVPQVVQNTFLQVYG